MVEDELGGVCCSLGNPPGWGWPEAAGLKLDAFRSKPAHPHTLSSKYPLCFISNVFVELLMEIEEDEEAIVAPILSCYLSA